MGRFRSMIKRAKKRMTNALLCSCSFQDLPKKKTGDEKTSSNSSVSSSSSAVSTSYNLNNATFELNKRYANARKAAIKSGSSSTESANGQPNEYLSSDKPACRNSPRSINFKSSSCENIRSSQLAPSVSQISLKSVGPDETEKLGNVPSPQSNSRSTGSNTIRWASNTPSPVKENTESANPNSTLLESEKAVLASGLENNSPTCGSISDPTLQRQDSTEIVGMEAASATMEQPQMQAVISTTVSPISSAEGIPVNAVFGTFNQGQIPNEFAGSQCTSIALTALAYHDEVSHIKYWNSLDLDNVLRWGTSNHHMYRTVMGFSSHPDGRISLSDLPTQSEVQLDQKTCLFSTSEMVFGPLRYGADVAEETEGIPSLGKGLRAVSYCSKTLLITINCFSHAIIAHKESYYLIDSHGHLNIPGMPKNNNSVCLKFSSQRELVAFLIRQYHDAAHYEVMPVHIFNC
ncbi:hypothetical protein ACJMK2_022878 [Sinanodonta woodiana]|uniref:Peptidase C76 domain-containing protein n=1 Tax=Sinanodonta woodiana TaxID=1069815 RepID=A0ABD3TKC6_SINWO